MFRTGTTRITAKTGIMMMTFSLCTLFCPNLLTLCRTRYRVLKLHTFQNIYLSTSRVIACTAVLNIFNKWLYKVSLLYKLSLPTECYSRSQHLSVFFCYKHVLTALTLQTVIHILCFLCRFIYLSANKSKLYNIFLRIPICK